MVEPGHPLDRHAPYVCAACLAGAAANPQAASQRHRAVTGDQPGHWPAERAIRPAT